MRFKLMSLLLVSASVAFASGVKNLESRFLVADSFIDPNPSTGSFDNSGLNEDSLNKSDTSKTQIQPAAIKSPTALSPSDQGNGTKNIDENLKAKPPLVQRLPVSNNPLEDSKISTPTSTTGNDFVNMTSIPFMGVTKDSKDLKQPSQASKPSTDTSDMESKSELDKKASSKASVKEKPKKQEEGVKIPEKRAERKALEEEYKAKLQKDIESFKSDEDKDYEVLSLEQARKIHELKKERYMLRAQVYYKDLGVLEQLKAKDKSGYYVGISYLANLSKIASLDSNFLGLNVGYISYITPRQAFFAEVRGFSNLTLASNFYSIDLRFAALQEIGQSFFESNDVGIYGGVSLGKNTLEDFTPSAFFGLSILVYKHNRINLEWSVPFLSTSASFDSLYATSYSYKF
ncbi:hypothetical protein [Helicobacter sp. 11S02629-2]|uniref:hypothetical protein n=1 Tax=Helicobacter sp. 11S02629-2 TaxID=1476195 RepID=UPI000BA63901|nr:hypothetical protein [Helicobacter sp. 11S02629-2]PAF45438.1 hypothetical protein BKH40_02935 [Helicobacter sp. 11S02629-2]